jgi:nicotinamidase/pyrazinamidase
MTTSMSRSTSSPQYGADAALLVIDVQNDFADPSGSLYVKGGEDVVRSVNEEIDRARHAGALVVYTQDWHPPSTPHFAKDGGVWPVHCVAGSWGAEFHPDLDAGRGPVVRKGSHGEDGYSGFTMRDPLSGATVPTGLADKLRDAGAARAVVVGLALDYCVKETALDAVRDGFPATVVLAATAPVEREAGDGERALAELVDAGIEVV